MKKLLKNRVFINTIVLTLYIFIVEMVVRKFTGAKLFEFSSIRILLSSLIVAFSWSWLIHFFKRIIARFLNVIFVLAIGIYEFVEFGLFNYLGFFMGVGNSEQGTKVLGYIYDFIKSLEPVHWCLLIPIILFLIYYIFIDRLVFKHWKKNTEFTLVQKIYVEVVCVIAIALLTGGYYVTIRNKVFQNELQTDSNYSLWLYPENSNLAVNSYGVLVYGFCDIKSQIQGMDADKVMAILEELEEDTDSDEKESTDDTPVEEEKTYVRTVDDTAWKQLASNTTNSTYKSLNTYFMNREVTPTNDMTGIFEGKNLIILLWESVDEISILNEEYFPTLYKLYNEGISFRNNFSPRNNCSTGNNEFTVLSSLFTINNTCTANTYASNTYFEGAFNIFKNAGYKTNSFHDYTQKYYKRAKIHAGLGVDKFYGVTDLGMEYDPAYAEWPSDVDMIKAAQPIYMNNDKFMVYFATVSTHQTYNVPSEMGDLYREEFEKLGYSKTLSRYLSKMKVLDKAMEELLNELEEAGKLDDTVIAAFGDHFPYGLTDKQINEYLEKNNAGYTVSRNSTTNKNVDRTQMFIYNSATPAKQVYDYTTIIDLLPTLMNMFNLDYDPRLYLGTDIFSSSHVSRAVWADGSWADENGFYYAPSSKMTYKKDATKKYTNSELVSINSEISKRQKMSASAIKNNYFKYLGEGLSKYQAQIDEEKKQEEALTSTTTTNASIVTTTTKSN